MLARRIAAVTTAVALAAPAAANAAPVVRHTAEGPAATPLIVELIAAAVIGVLFLSRRAIGRKARAVQAVTARRREQRRPARTAQSEGH